MTSPHATDHPQAHGSPDNGVGDSGTQSVNNAVRAFPRGRPHALRWNGTRQGRLTLIFKEILNANSDAPAVPCFIFNTLTTVTTSYPHVVAPTLKPAPMNSLFFGPFYSRIPISSIVPHGLLCAVMALPAIDPTKHVEHSDQRLQHAQALYEGYQAVMSPEDRDLAQDMLTQ